MAAQRLTNRRSNHTLNVRGYDEEVNINTPFDMTMLNDLVRFHLVMDRYRPAAADRRQGLAGDGWGERRGRKR